jgi:putative ABC transport system permease protein
LIEIPDVVKVASSTAVPGHNNNNNGYMLEGRADESFLMNTNWVDYDYFETYEIELAEGRFLSEEFTSDKDACVINETAKKDFGIDEPLNTRFIAPNEEDEVIYLPIVGVAKNFHHESLHSKVAPYVFKYKDETINWGYISVRLTKSATQNTIKEIEQVWKEFTSNKPLQFFFMDEDFDRKYREERQNAQLSIIFTVIAIIIASLGLFGLTSYSVQQRTKEIGIRRALGASIGSIFYLISKETILLVSISTIIAWPLIFMVAKNWLQNYYYRINLGIFEFVTGFLIALFIAIATISYRTYKSASVNPSDSLRYE